MPTAKQQASFVEGYAGSHVMLAQFFAGLLQADSYSRQNFKGKPNLGELNSALEKLDRFPLDKPVFYDFKTPFYESDLCAYIRCDEFHEPGGHLYSILIFDDSSMPDSVMGHVEIRGSQTQPEPAFTVNLGGEPKSYARKDKAVFKDGLLLICIDLLIDISTNHLNAIVPMEQIRQPDFIAERFSSIKDPKDNKLESLLDKLYKHKAFCFVAEISLDLIVPFSYNHCFKIPLYLIEQAEKTIRDVGYTMIVYQEGDKYIMSDCYPAYLAYRKMEYNVVRVVILAERKPKRISVLSKGGPELIPPVMAMMMKDYDGMDFHLKDLILQKYLGRISVLGTAKSLISAKCVVLTEDADITLLETLLEANDFNVDETVIFSYKNCTNLDSLDVTISTIRNVNPKIGVLVHRDRDYLLDEEVSRIVARIENIAAFPFVTAGTDLESHYINVDHIVALYPSLTRETVIHLIDNATEATSTISIERIKKHDHGENYKSKSRYIDQAAPGIYANNKERYRYGKKTLGILKDSLHTEVKQNISLIRATSFLMDPYVNTVARKLWKHIGKNT